MAGRPQREHIEGLGDYLAEALHERRQTQQEFADQARLSRATMSLAIASSEATGATVAMIAHALGLDPDTLLARARQARGGGATTATVERPPVIRRTPQHTEAIGPVVPPRRPAAWPSVARAREQELRAEAARAGLDDEELAAISRTLRDLATAPILDHGGRPRALSDAEILEDVEATADALRAWIAVRAKRRSGTGP